jgi:flagella basal body P-ring formation protein FlgA
MFKNIPATLTLAFALVTSGHAAEPFQSHESIYGLVNDHIAQHINTEAEYEVELLPLDNLLQLPACTESLETFTTADAIKPGRNSIGVRCNADKKWSIFVAAVIKVYQRILVLTQAVQRDEIITRGHLSFEKRDVSRLNENFVTQPEQIENKQALRHMPAGAVLNVKNFVEPKLIKRGDKVIISATQPSFDIRMNGQAMMDGIKGQLIRVKNQNSGRIIRATVIEPGRVSVNH